MNDLDSLRLVTLGSHALAMLTAAIEVSPQGALETRQRAGLGIAQFIRVAMRHPEWGLAIAMLADEYAQSDNAELLLATVPVSSVTGR